MPRIQDRDWSILQHATPRNILSFRKCALFPKCHTVNNLSKETRFVILKSQNLEPSWWQTLTNHVYFLPPMGDHPSYKTTFWDGLLREVSLDHVVEVP